MEEIGVPASAFDGCESTVQHMPMKIEATGEKSGEIHIADAFSGTFTYNAMSDVMKVRIVIEEGQVLKGTLQFTYIDDKSAVRFDGSVSGRVYMIFKTQFGLKGSKEVRAW